jgi:MinD superfamily P-loop ATPase
MDLSEYDSALSLSLNSNNAISTLQNLPGAFYELIKLCAERYDFDYVLIDMNPGLSAINQTLFMSADAFIVPTNPDPFSLMALKTLKTILPRWKKWALQSKTLFADASYPLPTTEMKFVGEVIQRFNLRSKKPANSYKGKIDEIKSYVESEFVPVLMENDMIYDIAPLINEDKLTDHCLAEISEFGALLQKANDHNVPVIALTNKQIGTTGPVLETMSGNRKLFYDIFIKIANIVLELVN